RESRRSGGTGVDRRSSWVISCEVRSSHPKEDAPSVKVSQTTQRPQGFSFITRMVCRRRFGGGADSSWGNGCTWIDAVDWPRGGGKSDIFLKGPSLERRGMMRTRRCLIAALLG